MLELLGIGVGGLELALERVAFHPGDAVRGELRLALRAPQDAAGVIVGVRARQKVVDRHRAPHERVHGYRTETVWELTHELAGAGRYTTERFPFELAVPSDVFQRHAAPPPGLLGDLARAVSYLQPRRRFPLQWHVFGALRRPWKLDLKKRVDIVVTARPGVDEG